MADFETLKQRMQACAICKDLPLGPKPIFQLDSRARLLIAGQAPGRITHHKGRPFDDPSGDRLRDWLGVDQNTFYNDPRIGILPMAFCFPGSGNGGDAPPPPICAATWRKPALGALENLTLTIILGAHAIGWHTPHLKGTSVVAAVKAYAHGQDATFILPHPSPRNNRWLKQNPWFESDVIPRLQAHVRDLLSPLPLRPKASTA